MTRQLVYRTNQSTAHSLYFPAENETTAHFPFHAHFLAPESLLPSSISVFNFSSSPGFNPTTTSALHVRSAKIFTPEPGPSGPIAVVNGVVGSQFACPVRYYTTKLTQ